MPATITGAKRHIIYKPGLNNVWIQLHRFWVGYVFARCGTPPARISMDMDEQGMLTITPDFELEGEEIAEKRKAAMLEGHNGEAEVWLRAHGLWQSDEIKHKRGRPVERRIVPNRIKESQHGHRTKTEGHRSV